MLGVALRIGAAQEFRKLCHGGLALRHITGNPPSFEDYDAVDNRVKVTDVVIYVEYAVASRAGRANGGEYPGCLAHRQGCDR